MKIAVIGAGPSGSTAAEHLARAGHDVDVYEENPSVGKPCHCTGLVTEVLWNLVPKNKALILNTLNGVIIHAPNGTTTEIPLKEYVLDRAALDKHLAIRAQDAGATLHKNHRFLRFENGTAVIKHGKTEIKCTTNAVIGADGSRSATARSAGIYGTRKFYFGAQATAKGKFDPDKFHVWFGGICPKFFAWSVPESSTVARIGIAALEDPTKYFQPFLRQHARKILSYQGGPIPIYNSTQQHAATEHNPPVYLIGDAAGLVKATTGGGIITGMLSGITAAKAIHEHKDYEKLLAPLKKELWIHAKLRSTLNNFSDQDYNKLITFMQDDSVKKILENNPREYPSKFILKLLFAEPRFVLFAKNLF